MARTRLTALDASFLAVESPTAHMHVAWKGRFAPRGDGGRPSVVDVRRCVGGRLRHAPRFRQRLAPTPAAIAEPVWTDDERFDLGYHVVGFEGTEEPLARRRFDELADAVLSEPLDRSRSLWRLFVAPRLDDDSVGVVMKVHHSMVDGKSAVELALLLLDLEPDAAPGEDEDGWAPAPAPGAARLAVDALADRSTETLRAAASVARLAASPRRGVRLAETLRRTALAVGEDVLRPAPSSYVNAPIGPARTLVHHTARLPPLLRLKDNLGVTLNDVALTGVAGALRTLAVQKGTLPTLLKTMVPVSTRAPEEAADLGNRISFVFIDLPLHLQRAEDRLEAVHAQSLRFKRDGRAAGTESLLGALGLLPAPLKDAAARLAAGPRAYNLTVSNVPGPRFPVYLLGCELLEAVPVIPLSDGHKLAVGIFSHCDKITFGAHADPDALPAVRQFPAALSASLLELVGLAARRRGRRAAA